MALTPALSLPGRGSEHWRFLAYLFLFMASMPGVVMAGDVITLFSEAGIVLAPHRRK